MPIKHQQIGTYSGREGESIKNALEGQPLLDFRVHFISGVWNTDDADQAVTDFLEYSTYTCGRLSLSEHTCPPSDPSLMLCPSESTQQNTNQPTSKWNQVDNFFCLIFKIILQNGVKWKPYSFILDKNKYLSGWLDRWYSIFKSSSK